MAKVKTTHTSTKRVEPYRAIKGMHDILPEEQTYWSFLNKQFTKIVEAFGFQRIDTPFIEELGLYTRSTGEFTDIVEKEMYLLKNSNPEQALRPEFTPGICRAYLEHGMQVLPQPVKLYTTGANFRHEQPQRGRFRQLHQFDLEVIGEGHSVIDAHLIQTAMLFFKKIGLPQVIVQINSIGDNNCRPDYREALLAYYKQHEADICEDDRRRLKVNPLRVLDCKKEQCQSIIAGAPQSIDHLCDACHDHFKYVLEYLDELGIVYELNHKIVRGLDYYSRTVFEFILAGDDRIALGGGGRYDYLFESIGGQPTPAAGLGLGADRIVMALQDLHLEVEKPKQPQVHLITLGDAAGKKGLRLFEDLWRAQVRTSESFGKNSLKAQLRAADKGGVKLVAIVGQKEAMDGTAIIRDMASGMQEVFPVEKVIDEIKKRL